MLAALAFALASAGALAQAYPSKPIRVVVPNLAGGYTTYRPQSGKGGREPRPADGRRNRVGAGGSVGTITAKSPRRYTIMVGGIGPHGSAEPVREAAVRP